MPGFDGYLYDPSSLPKVDHVQYLLSENLVLEGPNVSVRVFPLPQVLKLSAPVAFVRI
jgi:hypothetical protein